MQNEREVWKSPSTTIPPPLRSTDRQLISSVLEKSLSNARPTLECSDIANILSNTITSHLIVTVNHQLVTPVLSKALPIPRNHNEADACLRQPEPVQQRLDKHNDNVNSDHVKDHHSDLRIRRLPQESPTIRSRRFRPTLTIPSSRHRKYQQQPTSKRENLLQPHRRHNNDRRSQVWTSDDYFHSETRRRRRLQFQLFGRIWRGLPTPAEDAEAIQQQQQQTSRQKSQWHCSRKQAEGQPQGRLRRPSHRGAKPLETEEGEEQGGRGKM